MRRIVSIAAAAAAFIGVAAGAVIVWRRNPRIGSAFVNTVVNPRLLRRGLAGGAVSEIGTLEHVGRSSGIRRLTPVHPQPTPEGFRIIVPLGPHSQWARNVLAAGHCRLQLHDVVYDLDEPKMIPASDVSALPPVMRGVMAPLGFQYLTLRTFGAGPGALAPTPEVADAATPAEAPALGASAVPENAFVRAI